MTNNFHDWSLFICWSMIADFLINMLYVLFFSNKKKLQLETQLWVETNSSFTNHIEYEAINLTLFGLNKREIMLKTKNRNIMQKKRKQ